MTDKQPIQASGNGDAQRSDGVNNPPSEESQGGAYPSPKRDGDFDGGQTHKEYEGPDNPNATTEGD
jgi:hypothetical protein